MEIKDIVKEIKNIVATVERDIRYFNECKEKMKDAKILMERSENALASYKEQLDEKIRNGDQTVYFDKMNIEDCEVKVVKSSPAVVVEDMQYIPEQFIINKPQVDKKAIKEALESGEEVEGASMREVTYNLKIEVK